MTLYLVRQAKSVPRSSWRSYGDRSDRLRPLTPGGHRQALRLVERFQSWPVERIVSSPYLRCRQTVEPLAAHRGLPLEIDARLGEGAPVEEALELIRSLAAEAAVLCGHGSSLPEMVERLCAEGRLRDSPLFCEKGSVWKLDRSRARYFAAPARGIESAPALEALEPLRAGEGAESEDGERRKLRVGVIDLGSTSFHLLVADATPLGDIQRVVRERRMLRLGSVIATDRRVPEPICERAVEAARELREVAVRSGADRLLPVGTAALREAENGRELADRIAEAIGSPVRILAGEEEARLMFAAFRHRVPLGEGPALGIDLGGGSLELAIGDALGIHWETTLPLGVARLHRELGRGDPMPFAERRALRKRVRDQLSEARKEVELRRPTDCVAAGGTVGALARRVATRRTSWPRRSVSQLFVPLEELRQVAEELVGSSHDERLRMPGIARQRIDLLPTGAVVMVAAAEALGLAGFTVSDWGLREGVILEALGLARAERPLGR